MSTIKANQWLNPDGTENYKCRAWVNFNGTGTVAIRASGNVSSITDNGAGDYTVNFTVAMADGNYCAIVSGNSSTAEDPTTPATPIVYGQHSTKTVSACRVISMYGPGGASLDSQTINVSIFR